VAKKKRLPQRLKRGPAWLAHERERITEPWRVAIFTLREQLADDCLNHVADRRCLQNRRLIENLYAEFGPSPRLPECDMMAYWLFCGSPWQDQLSYNDARQQHYAELRALGLSPEFHHSMRQTKTQVAAFVIELLFRLDSLASWIEAQESWIFWRKFRTKPAAWDRHDEGARRQTIYASLIAALPTVFDGISDRFIAEVIDDFRRWTKPQWVKILKMAARIAERGERPVTELDTWVWWRYPIFSRYHWSAGEVCRAAREKFGAIHDVIT